MTKSFRSAPALCLLVGLGLALLSGCGGGPCGLPLNKLRGSVDELYDVEVDSVRARLASDGETMTVDYKHGNDSVAKVVAGVKGFSKGASIPLVDGDVFRVTSPDTQFPRQIARGQVTIESELSVGSTVQGCFNVLFQLEDGSQRTLEGAFETTLEEGL
jgi:hypothetical protein